MENNNVESLLQKYSRELHEDLKIDELTIKEKSMMVPIIKHKWVSLQMNHKSQLKKLEGLRTKYIKEFASKSPIVLSKVATEQALQNDVKFISILEKIEELQLVVEYLEKIEKAISSLTYDCKNVIDLQKLETT